MILEVATSILAIPAGYIIAWLARDELKDGRKWFVVLMILGSIIGIWFYIDNAIYISLSCLFIVMVSSISVIKSYDKKWTGKR